MIDGWQKDAVDKKKHLSTPINYQYAAHEDLVKSCEMFVQPMQIKELPDGYKNVENFES